MKIYKLSLLVAPVLFLVSGCINSHRQPSVVYYTPAAVPVVVPTGDRAVVRVYPGTPPAEVVAPPTTPPPGVLASDVNIAQSVGQLLKTDTSLADASRNVEVTVDHGVVTLRGTVPTDHDRDEIVERVSRVPGVIRVHDHLGVELR